MKNFSLISLLTLVMAAGIYFKFFADSAVDQDILGQSDESKNSESMPDLAKSNAQIHTSDTKVEAYLQANEEDPNRDSGGIAGTPAEAEIVRKWELDRGYLGKDRQKLEEYKGFDVPTLKIMIDSGDILAQSELVGRLYGEARTKEIFKALAMGSTSAVMSLGIELEVAYEDDAETDEERKRLLKEIFAVYEMGALRGDRYNQIVLQNDFTKKHSIKLTEEDKAAIKQRGKELYDEIQQLRFELGMDEFDNSVPPEVSNYYNNLYKFTYEGAFRD